MFTINIVKGAVGSDVCRADKKKKYKKEMEIGNLTDGLFKAFAIAIIVYALCYVFVLLAIAGDLISGVRKAKSAGIARTSEGFKRTIEKIAKYYNMLFAISILDAFVLMMLYVLQLKGWLPSIPLVPIFTVIGGCYLAFVEARSVGEKLEDKERARIKSDFAMFAEILKDEDKIKKAAEILKGANEMQAPEKRDINNKNKRNENGN